MGYGGHVVRSAKVKGVVLETDIVVVGVSDDVVDEVTNVGSGILLVVDRSTVEFGSSVVKIGDVNGIVDSGDKVSGGLVSVISGSENSVVVSITVGIIGSVSAEGSVVVNNGGSRVVVSCGVLGSVGGFSVVVIIGGGKVMGLIAGSGELVSVVLTGRVVVTTGSVKGKVVGRTSEVVSETGCVEVISLGSVVVRLEFERVEDRIISVVVNGDSEAGSVPTSTNSVVVITGGPKVKVTGGSVRIGKVSVTPSLVEIGSGLKVTTSVVVKGISPVVVKGISSVVKESVVSSGKVIVNMGSVEMIGEVDGSTDGGKVC